MRTIGTLFSYVLAIALVVGGVALAVSLLTPVAATTQQDAAGGLSSSPRIAAWQERMAEEKVYAERQVARDAEEKARWAAISKARATPQLAAEEPRPRDLDDRERTRARQAQREAMRRAQRENARRNDAFAYAPQAWSGPQYNSIFSSMRESRGGN
jgi:hypothetical protein